MAAPNPDYYTGDLEKKFNYHWETRREIPNAWVEFVRLVDADTKPRSVRSMFYSANTPTVAKMSANAYYRWVRSLSVQRTGKIA